MAENERAAKLAKLAEQLKTAIIGSDWLRVNNLLNQVHKELNDKAISKNRSRHSFGVQAQYGTATLLPGFHPAPDPNVESINIKSIEGPLIDLLALDSNLLLREASAAGEINLVKYVLYIFKVSKKEYPEDSINALEAAVNNGHNLIVRELLKLGCITSDGKKMLVVIADAIHKKNLDVIKEFIDFLKSPPHNHFHNHLKQQWASIAFFSRAIIEK